MTFQAIGLADKLRFREQGFIVIRQVVKPSLIKRVRREVEMAPYAETSGWRAYFPKPSEISGNLAETVKIVERYAEELLGPVPLLSRIQFALSGRGSGLHDLRFHLDGGGTLQEKTLNDLPSFQLVCGVILTDLSETSRGNLIVKPGGHIRVSRFFQETDEKKFFQAAENSETSLAYWMAQWERFPTEDLVHEPITGREGDIVFFHSLLPHVAGPNTYADRPAVYVRLGHYKPTGLAPLRNLWQGWPNLDEEA